MNINLIPLIFLLLCFSCSDPQSTAEKFFNKVAVEQDFDGAYEMLTARTKKRISKEDFSRDAKELLSIKKYKDLYNYEAKRRDFKIVKTQKNGNLMETVYFTFQYTTRYRNFFSSHDARMKAANSDDPEKMYDDKFLIENKDFFDEKGKRLDIIKEDGSWKIDTNRPKDLISELCRFGNWLEDLKDQKAEVARKEKLQNTSYTVLLYKELGHLYGFQKSRKIALCVSAKIGEMKYKDVLQKYPDGPTEVIKNCSLAIVGYSLTK